MTHPFENIEVKETTPAELEITGEIPVALISKHRPHVIAEFQKTMEVPGFRKGHVPEKIVIERIGELSILHEAAEHIFKEGYPELVTEKELNVIGRPEISITKIAPQNPIGFTIKTALFPTIALPDYKAIAQEKTENAEPVLVTDEEVGAGIKHLLEQFSQIPTPHNKSEGRDPDSSEILEDVGAGKSPEEVEKTPPPELTDELVKTWGDFTDVADFKQKFRESIKKDKERRAREKTRLEIAEAIIEKSEVAMPRILIESELDTMIAQMRADIERMGRKFDEYLIQIKKTEDDLRKDWEKEAEKRAKLQLILNEIAKQENLMPKPEDIEKEAGRLHQHLTVQGSKNLDMNRIRDHVALMLMNENAFRFLEDQKEKEGASKK